MKNNKRNSTLLIIIAFTLINFACNKTKQHSKWLCAETWKVNEISIAGQPVNLNPLMRFGECAIYDEICFGTLQLDDEGYATFAWQIRGKGSVFELSDQSEIVNEGNEKAVLFSSSFSGIYQVTEISKKGMIITSDNCKTYAGKNVVIKLVKQ